MNDMIVSRIRDVHDYPKPGVLFKDITPLLADPVAFGAVVDEIAGMFPGVDKIAGIEARGFILAAPAALRAGAGFVPIRKMGKLPSETLAASYDLEYGSATIEVHRDAVKPGERVLIVDDVLATGGTAEAAVDLLRRAGAEVVGFAVLMELAFLKGRERLAGVDLRALVIV